MTSERKFVPEQKEVDHKKVAQVCVHFCLGECVAGVSKGGIRHYNALCHDYACTLCVCARDIFPSLPPLSWCFDTETLMTKPE